MGAWSESITGNDTASDLLNEYPAAFFKYEPDEAVAVLDQYVRENEFDESEPEEWCNYVYSLADYMWKKGILTDEVKKRALQMIDSGFGLDIWAESSEKMLKARKKVLARFREKITSPMPPIKKIKLDICQDRIFENGDVIAVQLQTAGKNYNLSRVHLKEMSEEDFHACDGKYILMQLIDCPAKSYSSIVPEIKDYEACFRLFDGIYDKVPESININELKPANFSNDIGRIISCFRCESKMFYFKRRKYQLICNAPVQDIIDEKSDNHHSVEYISFSVDYQNCNPDSEFLAAMSSGSAIVCGEYNGTKEQLREICQKADGYHRNLKYLHMSKDEKDKIITGEDDQIISNIESSINNGGKLLSIRYNNQTAGVITINGNRIDNLYIKRQFQGKGFDSRLLRYALSLGKEKMYTDVSNISESGYLMHLCRKYELIEKQENFGDSLHKSQNFSLMQFYQNFELTEKQENLGEVTRFTFLTAPVSM